MASFQKDSDEFTQSKTNHRGRKNKRHQEQKAPKGSGTFQFDEEKQTLERKSKFDNGYLRIHEFVAY